MRHTVNKTASLGYALIVGILLVTGVSLSVCTNLSAEENEPSGIQQASRALSTIREHIHLSQQKISSLIKDVDQLKKDQKTITEALVTAAASERQAAENIRVIEAQLPRLTKEKAGLEQSLAERRAKFAEVLAALERMGLQPPPALLVRPDDALTSVRSAVLLGSLVPELREQTDLLAKNVKQLTELTRKITEQHQALTEQLTRQAEEQKKLALLLTEKAKLQQQSEAQLSVERKQNEELAFKARSLEELLTELNRQAKLMRRDANEPTNSEALPDFSQLRGKLNRPVIGKIVRTYADSHSDSYGETIETSSGAIVTSPATADVVYAGPFRSYGQLVILDVGTNYHVVLAGLGHLNIHQGQRVLAGEPVGTMSDQNIASAAALDIGKSVPMLYIEFRKDGKPVDPSPWWVMNASGRMDNDS